MAMRFLYYVKTKPVIPDHLYDQAEKEFLARPEIRDSPLMNPGSDLAEDYQERVRALAFYCMVCGQEAEQRGETFSSIESK